MMEELMYPVIVLGFVMLALVNLAEKHPKGNLKFVKWAMFSVVVMMFILLYVELS